MPAFDFQFHALLKAQDHEALLGEVLFFPEISAYGTNPVALRQQLVKQLTHSLGDLPPKDLWRRRALSEPPVMKTVPITISPSRKETTCQSPVELLFHAVVWRNTEKLWLGYVPALGIEVFANSESELDEQLAAQIEFALKRKRLTKSLPGLVQLERPRGLEVVTFTETITLQTPKEIEKAEGEQVPKSTLKEIGTRLSAKQLPPAYEMQSVVQQLANLLSSSERRSVLLVGPSGVGKTAAVQELVRTKSEFQLGKTEFWVSSGARLVSGTSGFGMWQERCQALCEETKRRDVVLHLGSLLELLEAGRGGGSGQGVADFLRHPMDRREITVIVECTPEQRDVIERQSAGLLHTLSEIRVLEPKPDTGRMILKAAAAAATKRKKAALEPEALARLDRLHRRYATYSVYPGRPLRFLSNLQQDSPAEKPITPSDVITCFSNETGLPRVLLDENVPLQLDRIRDWFSHRVIGQPQAVDWIVDLIASIKAGMTQPDRPIASLLFIGPTGVGKTEMAKTKAEFFYQDRHRLIRIDMSEYADPFAVDRLIGGRFQKEGVLTSQVRDQPFGVVLLDEFEKADPSIFDLLLQVLGEGRLTDSAGQLADFRNSIVIMTSNLGVDTSSKTGFGFREDSQTGERLKQHFVEEVQKFLRPELYNRIDRIVDFAALDSDTLHKIAHRQLELVRKRDGIQYRGVSLKIEDAVMEELVKLGHDPRYGARPLKRVMERELLKPLAEGINRYTENHPLEANVHWDGEIRVKVKAAPVQSSDQIGSRMGVTASDSAVQLAGNIGKLRRKALRLETCVTTLEFQNEQFRLEQQREQLLAKNLPPDGKVEARLKELHQFFTAMKSCHADVMDLEEDHLMALYQNREVNTDDSRELLTGLETAWQEVLWSAYAATLNRKTRDVITLVIYAEAAEPLLELTNAYRALIEKREDHVMLDGLKSPHGNLERKLPSDQFWIGKPKENDPDEPRTILIGQNLKDDWKEVRKQAPRLLGLALRITGRLAFPLYQSEQGVHLITQGKQGHRCYVDTARVPLSEYRPPLDVDRKGFSEGQAKRRSYNKNANKVEDHWMNRELRWDGVSLAEPIIELTETRLNQEAEDLLAD